MRESARARSDRRLPQGSRAALLLPAEHRRARLGRGAARRCRLVSDAAPRAPARPAGRAGPSPSGRSRLPQQRRRECPVTSSGRGGVTALPTGRQFRRSVRASLLSDASSPCARGGEEPVRAPGGPAGPGRAMAGEPRAPGGLRAGPRDARGRVARQRGRGFGAGGWGRRPGSGVFRPRRSDPGPGAVARSRSRGLGCPWTGTHGCLCSWRR